VRFFLGTHQPNWLKLVNVPLFISRRRLTKYKKMPKAKAPWALDSGGFTELSQFGRWTISAEEYVEEIRRFQEVGQLEWCAIQDWMCEPQIINGGGISGRTSPGTGLSVAEHQRRTVDSLLELESLAPDVNFAPVLQGWEIKDYWDHFNLYLQAGIDLQSYEVVGLGSVCRRQNTCEVEQLVRELSEAGIKLHGFGFKLRGLQRVSGYLESADSLAWSFDARRKPPLPRCTHKNCANCVHFALEWYRNVMRVIANSTQEPPPAPW